MLTSTSPLRKPARSAGPSGSISAITHSVVARKRQTFRHDRSDILRGKPQLPAFDFAVLPNLQIDVVYSVRGNGKAQAFVSSGLRQDESVQSRNQTICMPTSGPPLFPGLIDASVCT